MASGGYSPNSGVKVVGGQFAPFLRVLQIKIELTKNLFATHRGKQHTTA